ncbi:MAG TPA: lysylphosphatidylglycerol synthase domain-containing protein [Polyangia bacterium]|nr:lysylphosphatidylglycerol synthase domain-containing protein [Polyangia bacterium]
MSVASMDVPPVARPNGVERARTQAAPRSAWWQRGLLLVGVIGVGLLIRSLPAAGWPALLGRVGPALPLMVAVALGWVALYSRQFSVILDGSIGWGRLIYNRVVGDAYNAIIPVGDLGGDPVRLMDLAAQVGTATAVRGMVIEHLVSLTGSLTFSSLSVLVAVRVYDWPARLAHPLTVYAAGALVVAGAVFLLATGGQSARLIGRLLRLFKLRAPELPPAVSKRLFARALGWNLLGRFGVLAEIAVVLLALGQPVRLGALVAINAILSTATNVFTFVPNGVGINEGASVLALSLTGYGEAIGLTVGLARRARQLLLVAAGVALHALRRPRSAERAAADARVPETL